MFYRLRLRLPDKMRRRPEGDILNAAGGGITLEDPARMEAIIREAISCIKQTKHAPAGADIRRAVEHVRSVPYGYYRFSPRVPNSYRYSVDGITMDVFHARLEDGFCDVLVSFSVEKVKHAAYGVSVTKRLGPGEVGLFAVVAVVRPDVAAQMAQREIAELEARFPGASAVFSPVDFLKYHMVSPRDCIVEDDGVLVLVRTPGWKHFLGTPVGWFEGRYMTRAEAPSNVYSFLQRHGVRYPRRKDRRAWTEELAMQIVFAFGPPVATAAGDSAQS